MSRTGPTILATVVLASSTMACRPSRASANPEDYFPLIQVAIEGGEIAAMIGRNEAIEAKNFAGCVAAETLSAAFDSAGKVLAGKLTGSPTIPGFDLDLADCMVFKPEQPSGEPDAATLVQGIAGVSLAVARHYAERIKGTDCRKGTAALAAVAYVEGAVTLVADEIAAPDGKLSVPDSPIDLKACGGY